MSSIPTDLTDEFCLCLLRAVEAESDEYELVGMIDKYRLAIIDEAMKLPKAERGQFRIAYRWLRGLQLAIYADWDSQQAAEIRAEARNEQALYGPW